MAAGMARLLYDDGFASACIAKGVQRARQFKWSETAARVYEVYRRAIEHRARATS